MPKAGTGWLFDQLQYHPDFWMPPIKELHYLNRARPRMRNAAKALNRLGKRQRADRRVGDERDPKFLQEAVECGKHPRDLERYAALFRYKGDLLSGDVSPGYSRLDEEVVEKIASTLPEVKVLLLVRDPVARVMSHISMEFREERFDAAVVNDTARFRDFLNNSKQGEIGSFPSRIVARWQKHAPRVQFHHVLFEDLANEPEKTRREILLYLGADPEKQSGELPAGHNRKATHAKLELSEGAKAILVEHFKDELAACAKLFGSHAENWAARYGL